MPLGGASNKAQRSVVDKKAKKKGGDEVRSTNVETDDQSDAVGETIVRAAAAAGEPLFLTYRVQRRVERMVAHRWQRTARA